MNLSKHGSSVSIAEQKTMPKLDYHYTSMKRNGWVCTTVHRSQRRFCGVCGEKMRYYHLRYQTALGTYKRVLIACKDCNRVDAWLEQPPLPLLVENTPPI